MAQIAANLQRIKNGQRRYAITPRIPAEVSFNLNNYKNISM